MSVADGASYRCWIMSNVCMQIADTNRNTVGLPNNMVGVLCEPRTDMTMTVRDRFSFWSFTPAHHKWHSHKHYSTNKICDVFDDKHQNGLQFGFVRFYRWCSLTNRAHFSFLIVGFQRADQRILTHALIFWMSAGMCREQHSICAMRTCMRRWWHCQERALILIQPACFS